jgi:hypothetical protein
MAEDSNSVSYLMALKHAAAADSETSSHETGSEPSKETPGSSRSSAHSGVEKRRSPRYKCEGSAEMHKEGDDAHRWATFTDISLHGCYVEATETYVAGTVLDMTLSANGFNVNAKGSVRVTYPYLGMGIAFTEVSAQDRANLRELLRSISRPSVILGSLSSPVASILRRSESLPPVTHPEAAIKAIVQFFEERQLLTRDEFSRLLHRSQRA